MKREEKKGQNVALVHHNDIKRVWPADVVSYVLFSMRRPLHYPIRATVADMNRCTGWTRTTNAIPTVGDGGSSQKSAPYCRY